MASTAIVAVRMEQAHEKALAIVEELGAPDRVENLQTVTVGQATLRNPAHLASFQAELIVALAEVLEGQERRISDQERRISELEKAASTNTKVTKK